MESRISWTGEVEYAKTLVLLSLFSNISCVCSDSECRLFSFLFHISSVGDGTVDYEYSRNLGNSLGDPSHASLDGTLCDASSRIENSLARGVLAEQSTIFSDDASFEAQYNETGSSVEVDVIDVLIPPGKLGVIIDTPDDSGPPILYAIKDTSCVAHVLKVGDKLIAVDGEDVRGASAIRVSKLIARKSSNQWRTFTILRRNL